MRRMFDIAKRTSIVIVLVWIAGDVLHAQVPDAYKFIYSRLADGAEFDTARKTLPFTSISITYDPCFGQCPIYTATFNIDGSATYEGKGNVERIGRYSGTVDLREFGQLCLLIERSGFMKLAEGYSTPWTDAETVTVRVTRRNGESKAVANYGRFAPPEAWTVERAIAGIVAQVRWRPATATK